MISDGDLVYLVSPKGKRFLRVIDPDLVLHTHDGKLALRDVCEADYGYQITTHLGISYRILKPTVYDLLKNIERRTQIIYPKDIGYILLKLGIGPGSKVIEAGSGSGSLTMALAWFAGSKGKVFTYESREEFYNLCQKNLSRVGFGQNVVAHQRDISDGFGIKNADTCFLDVRTPWDYLTQVRQSVQNGSPVGFLVPTVNQVQDLLEGLENNYFYEQEIIEILIRKYKPVPERLRPDDKMVAHTGYLIFARA
ncbi:MAG TPA: tRNA (adenine-N1)-methyltransferase [Desulfohalobiaceae bacterium]|nr:tRNA (adenine-N1)-methyltransferase [Desulfohalobiaceae bacterium]